jgi:hypothetical protein
MSNPTNMHPFAGLPRFIYGTTRLGHPPLSFDERVRVARAAMAKAAWFHTSHQYDDALQVLGRAFAQDPAHRPKLIFKLGGDDIAEMRALLRRQIDAVGADHMDIAQLCLGGAMAEQFRTGGACYGEFRRLRDEGLVRQFVVEVFPWTSAAPLDALRGGWTRGLVDGCIFYLNPLQRFAANPLWDFIQEHDVPVLAMRTVCGAPVHRLRDVPGAAWKDYLQRRAVEIAPIFERSGVASWTEFCVRFAFGFPQVRATVGSTARPEHLDELVRAAQDPRPLPQDIQREIAELQRRWSDETDVKAEPWSM